MDTTPIFAGMNHYFKPLALCLGGILIVQNWIIIRRLSTHQCHIKLLNENQVVPAEVALHSIQELHPSPSASITSTPSTVKILDSARSITPRRPRQKKAPMSEQPSEDAPEISDAADMMVSILVSPAFNTYILF